MTKLWLRVVVIAVGLGLSGPAWAGGPELQERQQRQLGALLERTAARNARAVSFAVVGGDGGQDLNTLLVNFITDLRAGTIGATDSLTVQHADGTVAAPSITFATDPNTGLYATGSQGDIAFSSDGVGYLLFNGSLQFKSDRSFQWSSGAIGATSDLFLFRDAAAVLALKNGANSQTFRIYGSTTGTNYVEIAAASQITAGTHATVVKSGSVNQFTYKVTVTATTCLAPFAAAALTADCTIATLPAKTKLLGVYADVTAAFTCSGTCTGTKTIGAGISAGGVEILAAGLNVAATGQLGDADAELGSGMTRAAAIQGGYLPSWSGTSAVSVRFTSGTGNWGDGALTFVNAGSITFYLTTEALP